MPQKLEKLNSPIWGLLRPPGVLNSPSPFLSLRCGKSRDTRRWLSKCNVLACDKHKYSLKDVRMSSLTKYLVQGTFLPPNGSMSNITG